MADQGGGFLAKTGLDSIKLGGHKIPIALIGGVAALAGVVLILRARSQQGNVASVGQAPYTAASSGFGTGSVSPDYGPALANLSQQLTSLGQGINSTSPPAAPTAQVLTGSPASIGWDFYNSTGQHGVPLYAAGTTPGTIGSTDLVAPYSTLLTETGSAVTLPWVKNGKTQSPATFYPVNFGGSQYYVSDVVGTTHTI